MCCKSHILSISPHWVIQYTIEISTGKLFKSFKEAKVTASQLLACACMSCQRITCLFDFQSTSISYRSYSNIDQRTNDVSFTLFCRNWMKVLLHVSFSNGLPYT